MSKAASWSPEQGPSCAAADKTVPPISSTRAPGMPPEPWPSPRSIRSGFQTCRRSSGEPTKECPRPWQRQTAEERFRPNSNLEFRSANLQAVLTVSGTFPLLPSASPKPLSSSSNRLSEPPGHIGTVRLADGPSSTPLLLPWPSLCLTSVKVDQHCRTLWHLTRPIKVTRYFTIQNSSSGLLF